VDVVICVSTEDGLYNGRATEFVNISLISATIRFRLGGAGSGGPEMHISAIA